MRFIIRGMGVRNIREGSVEKSFTQAVEAMDFKYEMPGFKANETFDELPDG